MVGVWNSHFEVENHKSSSTVCKLQKQIRKTQMLDFRGHRFVLSVTIYQKIAKCYSYSRYDYAIKHMTRAIIILVSLFLSFLVCLLLTILYDVCLHNIPISFWPFTSTRSKSCVRKDSRKITLYWIWSLWLQYSYFLSNTLTFIHQIDA